MMKRLILASALLLATSATSGCFLYTDDGDDAPCALYEQAGFRNPVNGACEYGGGGGCGDGAIDGDQADPPGALPDMASCPGECEALDEQTCLATPACRAAYLDDSCGAWADCAPPANPTFFGCWGTAPSGPIQGGGCENLDAWECSRHDDCTAHYVTDWGGGAQEDGIAASNVFSYCSNEEWGQGCYSDLECPAGWECSADTECLPPPGCDPTDSDSACEPVCYGRCVPAQNGCELVECAPGYHCELNCLPCDGMDPNGGGGSGDAPEPPPGCDAACEVTCVPDQTWECEAILCAPGYHCETVCADFDCPPGSDCPQQCWSDCVEDVPDPGTCDGDVFCDSLPPACPDGTLPGIRNGCWSGYCIPVGDCDLPPQSCESLADEASCAARFDCQPVYQGNGCTCYADGTCTCEDWSYLRCETWGDDQPVMPF